MTKETVPLKLMCSRRKEKMGHTPMPKTTFSLLELMFQPSASMTLRQAKLKILLWSGVSEYTSFNLPKDGITLICSRFYHYLWLVKFKIGEIISLKNKRICYYSRRHSRILKTATHRISCRSHPCSCYCYRCPHACQKTTQRSQPFGR